MDEDSAFAVIDETVRILAKARESAQAGRWVEATGWIEHAKAVLQDQDVFPMLAAGEAIAVAGR